MPYPPHSLAERSRAYAIRLAHVLLWIVAAGGSLLLAAFGVVVALSPRHHPSRIESTRTEAQSVRSAAVMFVSEQPGTCPGVSDLVTDGYLDARRRTTDAWGRPFSIECASRDVFVRSAGPDGAFGSSDDVL